MVRKASLTNTFSIESCELDWQCFEVSFLSQVAGKCSVENVFLKIHRKTPMLQV